jgi:hypothetical protein
LTTHARQKLVDQDRAASFKIQQAGGGSEDGNVCADACFERECLLQWPV